MVETKRRLVLAMVELDGALKVGVELSLTSANATKRPVEDAGTVRRERLLSLLLVCAEVVGLLGRWGLSDPGPVPCVPTLVMHRRE